jgi:hypothetical protein
MARLPTLAALALSAAALTLITGCASHSTKPLSRVVPPASAQQKAASFDQVATLAGDWRVADDNGVVIEGENAATTRFEVSSGGKVIREIMFVGHPHEMTNVYHLDGEELVVTHYCAVGNQPRMRGSSVTPGRIVFTLDNVTNFTAKDQVVMGGLVLEIPDANTVREVWTHFQNGTAGEPTVITLKRVP